MVIQPRPRCATTLVYTDFFSSLRGWDGKSDLPHRVVKWLWGTDNGGQSKIDSEAEFKKIFWTLFFTLFVQPPSMIALARPQLASHQCLIRLKLLYLDKLITILFRLCLYYCLITATEAEDEHQDGVTLNILTTVWAFNRSVLTLGNNKKKERQLVLLHVHCVTEPNKIHCCLTADSALDTHF